MKARLKDVERLRQELATEAEAFEAEKTDQEIALKRKQEKMVREIEVMFCLQGPSLVIQPTEIKMMAGSHLFLKFWCLNFPKSCQQYTTLYLYPQK